MAFQKKITCGTSETSQGSGTLTESVLYSIFRTFHDFYRLLASCTSIGGGQSWYREKALNLLGP